MPEKTVVQKMMMKSGDSVVFVNAPEGYQDSLGTLPEQVTVLNEPSASTNIIQVFVNSKAELEEQLVTLKPLIGPNTSLWLAFRKGTSKPKTDFNRDDVLAFAERAGFQNMTLISLDADWSAFRFKITG